MPCSTTNTPWLPSPRAAFDVALPPPPPPSSLSLPCWLPLLLLLARLPPLSPPPENCGAPPDLVRRLSGGSGRQMTSPAAVHTYRHHIVWHGHQKLLKTHHNSAAITAWMWVPASITLYACSQFCHSAHTCGVHDELAGSQHAVEQCVRHVGKEWQPSQDLQRECRSSVRVVECTTAALELAAPAKLEVACASTEVGAALQAAAQPLRDTRVVRRSQRRS